jgi:hypothetical protein
LDVAYTFFSRWYGRHPYFRSWKLRFSGLLVAGHQLVYFVSAKEELDQKKAHVNWQFFAGVSTIVSRP